MAAADTGPVRDRSEEMRSFWDARAAENAMWYIHSQLDFAHPDAQEFWRSGEHNLDATLQPFGLAFRGDERVLEIGCGIGRMTRALAARAAEVVGVDVSEEMVRRGREALADCPNVRLELGTGRDLAGLADASFDVCYSFIVFQHIPDPAITCDYITEIGRVLRPGGWTLFQVSDRPEMHSQRFWRSRTPLLRRLRRPRGGGPQGCLDASWLGSAVRRADLLAALARGGLVLDRTTGDGTQFCFVLARKPGG